MGRPLQIFLVLGILCLAGAFAIKSTEDDIWKAIKGGGEGPKFLPGESDLINVSIAIRLNALSDLDEESGEINVIYWLTHAWKIPGVAWNPAKFNGVKQIQVPSNMLWLPDIVPYKQAGYAFNFDSRVVLKNTGDVLWVPSLRSVIPCEMIKDGPLYPKDRKICTVKLGSWTYSSLKVNLSLSSTKIENYFDHDLGNWKFLESTIHFKSEVYPCCPEAYQSTQLQITIERTEKYYGLSTLAPGIVIGIIIAVSYFIPPSSPARIIAQMFVLTTLVYVSLNRLPDFNKTGPIAPAAKYLMSAMLLDLLSIIWSVFAAVMWMQTADKGNGNGCLDSLLSKLECICCLPSASPDESKDGESAKIDLSQKRSSGLSSVQRLCLVLDRIFGLVDLVLFILLFCCMLS